MSTVIGDDGQIMANYLRALANRVGLRDWEVSFGKSTPQENGHAEGVGGTCDVGPMQKRLTIELRADWPTWDDDKLRHICTHELLHAHFEPMRTPLANIEQLIGGLVFSTVWDATTHAMEWCLDAIATEWAESLPTPTEWLEQETS